MTGIKLMMLGGGISAEDPGSVTYSAGYGGSIYEPVGWDEVTLTMAGAGGEKRAGGGYSTGGLGTKITKTAVTPSAVTLYVASGNGKPAGSPAGQGGSGGVVYHTSFNGAIGGAASAAAISGTNTVAAGGGGDSGKGNLAAPGVIGRPELGTPFYSTQQPTDENGVNGGGGGNYYGGGGGGGGGTTGGAGGNTSKGGEGGGNGTTDEGSINYTTRTAGDNAGNGYTIVSWG